jgi:uncharacterized radical SAM superfamily Fe-S cluster-containing enzyme
MSLMAERNFPSAPVAEPIGTRQVFQKSGKDRFRVRDHWKLPCEDDALIFLDDGRWARLAEPALDMIIGLHGLEQRQVETAFSPDLLSTITGNAIAFGLLAKPGENFAEASALAWDDAFTLLVLKGTNVCNIDCLYCYNAGAGGGRTITDEIGQEAIRRALDHAPNGLNLVFHGGEPFARLALMDRLCAFAREYAAKTGKRVRFNVQTNGLLFSEAALAFLDRHDVGVGVSLDGPGQFNALRLGHQG